MKIQTMSVVVGTTARNAKCPFCVSKTTPDANLPTDVNWRNFEKACRLAQIGGATTMLLTGKGEPTLYPDLITEYIKVAKDYFPFIELQTNGMLIKELRKDNVLCHDENFTTPVKKSYLRQWYALGLTTVSLSAVETGYANKKIYGDGYPMIANTAQILREQGFTVRLSIMMLKKYICKPKDIDRLVAFCKKYDIKQLTVRPINHPDFDKSKQAKWIDEHTLSYEEQSDIQYQIKAKGNQVLKLAHGATVYDYEGQNLCLSNCLTTNEDSDSMRQIIFYPDGTIGYDWKYEGAVLL